MLLRVTFGGNKCDGRPSQPNGARGKKASRTWKRADNPAWIVSSSSTAAVIYAALRRRKEKFGIERKSVWTLSSNLFLAEASIASLTQKL